MRKYILLFLLNCFLLQFTFGQDSRLSNRREIFYYHVQAKISEGRIKGILQHTTAEEVAILTPKGVKRIHPQTIRSLKIKFDKKMEVPFFDKMGKTAVEMMFDPTYLTSSTKISTDMQGNTRVLEEEVAPFGEQLLLSGAMIGGALVGNEIAKLIPTASIETFKINYSMEKYHAVLDDLAMYTVALQSSPSYNLVLKEKLKAVKEKNKIKKM